MGQGAPPLTIHLLGTPRILVSGAPLSLNHLKAKALLFYLAATGEPHSREHLATLLWSESASPEAHHSLRSSLYHLRQVMRSTRVDSALVDDGEVLSLLPSQHDCDVIEFRRKLAEGDEPALAQAVALYRGPLLQGFSLADAPAFDEWCRGEETRLSQANFGALDRLAGSAEARGAWPAAIGYLYQMAQIDPLDEVVQQRLIRAYLGQGEIGSAVHQFRQFESQLWQELRLAPSAETQALLFDALRQQRGAAPLAGPATSLAPQPQPALPFIGRDLVLEQLSGIARRVQAGQGATVLIEGEEGMGKSRLMDELASRLVAGTPPWIVLQGACSPFDDLLSAGPFLEALQKGAAGHLPDLSPVPDPNLPGSRGSFSWRVLQTLRSLTHTVPLLFLVDDLQWANTSTLNLFGYLSMRLPHLPVMLVGTVQHAEAIPALQRLITLGRRQGGLQLMSLPPLSQANVSALLRSFGLDALSVETLAEWLHDQSAGNPFLLSEVVIQLRKDAILRAEGRDWHLEAVRWWHWRATFTLPETTHDLVTWRLTNLSPEARRLLEVLAVAGQPLPEAVLRHFPGIPADRFAVLVDDVATRGFLVEPASGRLALPHHLLRETLLHRLSNLRRRVIYQELAETMEAHVPAGDKAALRQVALYAVAGEDAGRARRYGLAVLADLPQDYAGAETVDFVHHLYDLLAPTASPGEMVELSRALGALHQALGQLEKAAHWHRQYLHWAQQAGDRVAQAEAHFEMGELALMRNDYRAAIEAAQAGLDQIREDDTTMGFPESARGRGHRLLGAAFAMEGGDIGAAEHHLQAAVTALRQSGRPEDLCAALFELGNIAAQRGEVQRALDFYAESARVAEAGRIYYYLALARNNYAYHSLLLGRVDEAQEAAAQGLKVAERHDLLAALLHLYSTKGEIYLYLGNWKDAEEAFRRGLALADDLGSLERQAGYRGGLALAARGENDLEAARRLLGEALALIADQGYWHLRARLHLWLAQIAFAQQCPAEAALSLDAALGIARAHQRKLLLVQAQCLRAQGLAADGDWPAAEALFGQTLEGARDLGLPLEVARVQAAWGQAALRHTSGSAHGAALVAAARAVMAAHQARADLAALPEG